MDFDAPMSFGDIQHKSNTGLLGRNILRGMDDIHNAGQIHAVGYSRIFSNPGHRGVHNESRIAPFGQYKVEFPDSHVVIVSLQLL